MKKIRRLTLLAFWVSCLAVGPLYSHSSSLDHSFADPLECIELTTTVSNHIDGKITMWALDFVLNEDAYDEVLVSLNPNGPFTESFVADCIVGSQTYSVFIRATLGQEEYNCETVLALEDGAYPIPTIKNSVKLTLENGTATLSTDMIDYGSFDFCGGVEVALSKTEFNAEDEGENIVFAMVTDDTGNISYNYITVYVYDGSDCSIGAVIYPEDIEIYDPTNNDDNLSPDNLQSGFNYSFEEVHPYTMAECEYMFYSYTDQVISVLTGYKTIRTWTALDWDSAEIGSHVQILELYFGSSTLTGCDGTHNISVLSGPKELMSQDVVVPGFLNHLDLTVEITDENDNVIPDNILTKQHIGQALEFSVTQSSTGNSCWGNLVVTNDFDGCSIGNVLYPPSELQIDAVVNDPATLSVENLMENYGFNFSDVFIRYAQEECQVAGVSYIDEVVDNGDGSYTITRDFKLVDYILYNETGTSQGTYEFTQTITTAASGDAPVCNEFINVSLDASGQATLFAEVFVEGNPQVDVLEVSLNNIDFGPSVTFDCDNNEETLTVYVRSEADGNEYNCTSQVMVEDKLAPIVIVQDFTIDLESQSDTYSLLVSDVEIESIDNCPNFTKELSQTEFTSDHWGSNSVVLEVTDIAGQTASATSTVTVLIDGQSAPVECIEGINVFTSPWGDTEVWGADFVENADNFDQVLISFDVAGPYTESLIAPCGVNGQGSTTIFIQAFEGTTLSVCSSELDVIDNVPPVVVLKQNIELTLQNGTATLHPLSADNGSYDACTDVTLSLDKSEFTVDDLGENTVFMTVTDLNGNSNMSWTTVLVKGETECSLDAVIFPDDIDIFDENGVLGNLTIENLQSIYGYEYEEVYPYTPVPCEGIYYSYADQWITMTQGYKVIRTWTALDWLNTETSTNIQILKLFTGFSTTLACNDLEIITLPSSGSLTLWPSDVLEGGPYNYDNMTLTLEDSDGNIVVDNLITSGYIGATLLYTVTEETTGNMCWGSVIVQDGGETCLLDENDLMFPLTTIQISEQGIDPATLTPQYLVENYGFDLSEVTPTWPDDDCLLVGYAIEDDYFDFGDGTFKILRNFTIIDWYGYNPNTSDGIWYFTQIINIGIDPATLICDFLPRTADFGDCESGHTADDDVEWPADIAIADYRITPSELVEFSMVDVLDSEPSFYNDPDNYEASYTDLLVELTSSTITVGRVWAVTHSVYGFMWSYTQTIEVDFSDFENLVSVSTGTNRAMPGVIINDAFTTNMQGLAYVDGVGDVVATYEDDFLNGVNIVDVIRIQRHILGWESLTGYELIAADVNYDGFIKASDLSYMRNIMLEITEPLFPEWRFYEKEIEGPISVEPKAALLGVKAGDVDDSALLFGEEHLEPEANFEFVDQLLNNGETYSIPVYLEKEYSIYGLDFRLKLDTNILEIYEITSDIFSESIGYNINSKGELRFTVAEGMAPINIGGDLETPLFYIEAKAKENSLLSLALFPDDSYSFMASIDLELIVLGSSVEDMIGTGTYSPELIGLSVYPNPASDYLIFDLEDVSVRGDWKVTVFGLDGRQILNGANTKRLDVSDLSPGMYYYQLEVGTYAAIGKFIVTR